jgi:hypothetical protein
MSFDHQIESISVGYLQFDPENPRLPSTIDGSNQQAVIAWMLEDATIVELMRSIGSQNYFPGEPLLVVPTINPEHYEVIEGNRRLTAVKLLLNPDLAPIRKKAVAEASAEAKYKPATLPVLVFSSRDEIIHYLGYRHITGIKPWGSLAKAKYLKQLLGTITDVPSSEHHRTLARYIGSRSDVVARLLSGLGVYERIVENDFFDIPGMNEETIDFSILTTALAYTNTARFIGLEDSQDTELTNIDNNRLEELTSWIFKKTPEGGTRIGESRRLKELNSVISKPAALAAFRDFKTLDEAFLLTEEPTKIFRKSITEARIRLINARDYTHMLTEVTQMDSDNLKELLGIVKLIKASIDTKLLEEEE